MKKWECVKHYSITSEKLTDIEKDILRYAKEKGTRYINVKDVLATPIVYMRTLAFGKKVSEIYAKVILNELERKGYLKSCKTIKEV